MKAVFLALSVFLLMTGCYSVDFHPAADYPALRRNDIEDVEIRTARPIRPYHQLGQMIIRDPGANPEDENFRRFLRNEARDRGAEGVWIVQRRIRETAMHTTSQANPGGFYNPTGEVRMETNVLTIVLYNYVRTGTEQEAE
ncbi:MAG: hypothetical protein KDK34_21665 [Leptospiraceae bacterium]|nr:hypothetical protein [Leptospiraceae bacterium]MCB1322881.1 hypothetical protein [Leptospiraceae bacterium]